MILGIVMWNLLYRRFLVEYLLLCCRYIEVVIYCICIVWYFYAYVYACMGLWPKAVNKESESESGVSVFHSCNVRIVWGLWSQSNFHDMIISINNIFWLHWIINRLVVVHPYALSHNKAVLNWNNFVWSIGLILIQGLIASISNKQQPTTDVS